jgi:glycolate oxidase iron-sulfur subunit
MGWQEAADLITAGLSAAIANKEVTYDLARLMEPPVEPVSCSGFADAVIRHFHYQGWQQANPSRSICDSRRRSQRPCVHCGFCLPTCASYRVLGTEMDSPRGRIHALKAIEAGELELDATAASHFDSCLGCFACVTRLPFGRALRPAAGGHPAQTQRPRAAQPGPNRLPPAAVCAAALPAARCGRCSQPLRAYAGQHRCRPDRAPQRPRCGYSGPQLAAMEQLLPPLARRGFQDACPWWCPPRGNAATGWGCCWAACSGCLIRRSTQAAVAGAQRQRH